MAKRTFNYTDRKKIVLSDIGISLSHLEAEKWTVTASADLAGYGLPADSVVVMEVYSRGLYRRVEIGPPGELTSAKSLPLELPEGTVHSAGFYFKLKVLPADGARVLLGVSKSIRPTLDHDLNEASGLLGVRWSADLGKQVWDLDLDGEDKPVLLVNDELHADLRDLVRSIEFSALVLPQALNRILNAILVERDVRELDDDGWEGAWLKFTASELGAGPPPQDADDDDDKDWIEGAVTTFCRKHDFSTKYAGALENRA